MLEAEDIKKFADEVEDATEAGLQVREKYRRSRDVAAPERVEEIQAAIDRLSEAMKPVRRAMGMVPYLRLGPGLEDRLRTASEAAQRERRKLRKMLYVVPATKKKRRAA